MVLDKNGDLIITEFTMDRIKKISTKTGAVTTLAGTGHSGFSGDGGLFISQYGYGPNSHRIRRVDAATGIIETIAGLGGQGYAGDGGPALSAQLGSPSDLVIDAKGNLWVVDPVNDHVRRIDNTSGFIDTVAGSVKGFFGDGGPATAARLSNPSGIALDSDGNLYIAEFVNNRVRCVDHKSGKIRTVAGNGLPHRVDVMM
jgi:DNA-binding beta-propeller fold protein YncE